MTYRYFKVSVRFNDAPVMIIIYIYPVTRDNVLERNLCFIRSTNQRIMEN